LRDTRLNSSRTFVELIFARKETPLRRVLQLMATHDVHHVYVIDENDRPNAMITPTGAFCSLVPIRPRSRGGRRSLRTLPGASLRPPLAFNPRHRRLSTPLLTPFNSTFQPRLSTPRTCCGCSRWTIARARGARRGRRRTEGPRESSREE
jgi:CBS domain-containing protein